ncbi:CRTAC1 family protein [Acidicapsa acidisoli]|uniref:CRTAC1 family protein n=1 Tax=Acidicapsa acidisoli TaxID=1615681 RepID=UPI0021DFEE52|nr:CRTAC1 family protein [Acidicapsa acidisoli]
MKDCCGQRTEAAGIAIPRFLMGIASLCAVVAIGCLAWGGAGHASAQTAKTAEAQASASELVNYPELVDITASTGIQFEHMSSPEQKYIVESMSGGVALIDYDGDGWLDIYFTNAQSVEMALHGVKSKGALYRNNHDGTFTDVTDKAGVGYPCWAMGASVGDYNNDGWPDLLVTCFDGVVLYRNNGDGTFTDVTKSAGLSGDKQWATGAAFGDYDGDGWADLFVSHYVDFHLDDMAAFGSKDTCKYIGIDVQCGPRGLKGAPDSLYHNNRDGTFTDVSKKAGVSDEERRYGLTAIWSDFDNDGKLDLLVTDDAGPNYLYQGDGKGNFVDAGNSSGVAFNENGAAQANMGIAIGDYLHTGRMSLVISHFDNEYAAFYRNDGGMNFTDISGASGIMRGTRGYVGWGDAFVDFANSGWQDFFVVNGHVYPQVDSVPMGVRYRERKLLFLNGRDGKFKDISKEVGPAIQIPQVSRGMAIGDLFNDGKIEAVVENLVGKAMILRPEGGPKNHWISFQLEGVQCNRLALNARVQATAGELVQLGEVISSGSYLSQNDLRIHFGLGSHDRVDKAKVLWPDGRVETLTNLAVDRFYSIKEGSGVVAQKLGEADKLHRP